MINRLNNISFKQAIVTPSFVNLSDKNTKKLDIALEIINSYYPQNDVFLCSNEDGELVYHIKKNNSLLYLFNPDILKEANIDPLEFLKLLNICEGFKQVYNSIHNIKEPVMSFKTENIDNMKPVDIATQVNNSLLEFNKKYPPEKSN